MRFGKRLEIGAVSAGLASGCATGWAFGQDKPPADRPPPPTDGRPAGPDGRDQGPPGSSKKSARPDAEALDRHAEPQRREGLLPGPAVYPGRAHCPRGWTSSSAARSAPRGGAGELGPGPFSPAQHCRPAVGRVAARHSFAVSPPNSHGTCTRQPADLLNPYGPPRRSDHTELVHPARRDFPGPGLPPPTCAPGAARRPSRSRRGRPNRRRVLADEPVINGTATDIPQPPLLSHCRRPCRCVARAGEAGLLRHRGHPGAGRCAPLLRRSVAGRDAASDTRARQTDRQDASSGALRTAGHDLEIAAIFTRSRCFTRAGRTGCSGSD